MQAALNAASNQMPTTVVDTRTKEEVIAEYEAQKQAEADALAERQRENAERIKQYAEEQRQERNKGLQKAWDESRFVKDYENYSSGVRGYHFLENVRGNDGNFYAVYTANRGDNKRYFSISERKWYNDLYPRDRYCGSCQQYFKFYPSGFDNTCPNDGSNFPSARY